MSEANEPVTACLIIIGNEILSGRTADANLPYIATRLGEIGVRMAEARVVPDDESAIVAIIQGVLDANADAVATYRGGKTTTFGFLVGQVMKQAAGKANPKRVNELLKRALDS